MIDRKMANDSRLQGLSAAKALVVEDEIMLFFVVEDELKKLGFGEVFHASGVDEALAAIQREKPDLAILDVNLAGDRVFPVAEKLREADVPFFFVTGYQPETIPEEWAGTVMLQKPVHSGRLRSAVIALNGREPSQTRRAPEGGG